MCVYFRVYGYISVSISIWSGLVNLIKWKTIDSNFAGTRAIINIIASTTIAFSLALSSSAAISHFYGDYHISSNVYSIIICQLAQVVYRYSNFY